MGTCAVLGYLDFVPVHHKNNLFSTVDKDLVTVSEQSHASHCKQVRWAHKIAMIV